MLNHKTNKFDIEFVSDFDVQDYLEQALEEEFGSYENINIDDYTLDFIDEKLNNRQQIALINVCERVVFNFIIFFSFSWKM